MAIQNRNYFFTPTVNTERFLSQDEPTEQVMRNFLDSVPFKIELADTATEEQQGLVETATQAEYDAGTDNNINGWALYVRPSMIRAAIQSVYDYFITEIGSTTTDITAIQNDITTIQGDITTLQTDVAALQTYNTFYTALITQVAGAPTVAIPTNGNTIGTIVWTYTGVGIYTGTLIGAFTGGVICTLVQGSWAFQPPAFCQISRLTNDTVQIRTYDATGVLADNLLSNANLRIEQYL